LSCETQTVPRFGRCRAGAALVVALLLVGCGSGGPAVAPRVGPTDAAPLTRDTRSGGPPGGVIFRSPAFAVHSTVADSNFNERLTQVLEGALAHYRQLVPAARTDPLPMDAFVFSDRRQWAEFTVRRTGQDAAIYLQINRGGYTVRDFFVAYYIGDSGTFAVAAHEGWHQFCARHFRDRLPPFLEEGIATTFENITWTASGLPRWDLVRNVTRAQRLRESLDAGSLWTLESLVSMHAGDVVGQSTERIEAFYAQSWAFARFLIDGDAGRHRPALQRMMADCVAGTLFNPGGRPRRVDGSFNPSSVGPMLEHYLGERLADLEPAYRAYLQRIAETDGARPAASAIGSRVRVAGPSR
jgi:hypothetical protein